MNSHVESVYKIETMTVRLAAREGVAKLVADPEQALEILRAVYKDLDADQEHFTALFLNKANRVQGFKVCFSGGQDETTVDLRVLFRNALLMGATGLIVAHNHPSGRKEPSAEDMALTRKIAEAGKLLGVRVIDHLILAGEEYTSFREMGAL